MGSTTMNLRVPALFAAKNAHPKKLLRLLFTCVVHKIHHIWGVGGRFFYSVCNEQISRLLSVTDVLCALEQRNTLMYHTH
jgi:hypothetical protein